MELGDYHLYQVISAVIMGIMTVPALFGNFIIMMTLIICKRKSPSYFLISGLAVIDFLAAGCCMITILISCITGGPPDRPPSNIVPITHNHTDAPPIYSTQAPAWLMYGGAWCRMVSYFGTAFFNIAYTQLAIISVDRFYAAVRPLQYRSHITRKRVRNIVTIAWTIMFLVGIYPTARNSSVFFRSGFICIGVVNPDSDLEGILYITQWVFRFSLTTIMIVCYTTIYFIAYRRHPSRIQSLIHQTQCAATSLTGNGRCPNLVWSRICQYNKQIKIATTLFIVIVAFIISWVPTFIAEQTLFKGTQFHHDLSYKIHMTLWAIYISPAVNPIIYALHNKTIRKMVIKCIRCKPTYRVSTSLGLGSHKQPSNIQRGEGAGLDIVKTVNPATPFRPRAQSITSISNIKISIPSILVRKKKKSVVNDSNKKDRDESQIVETNNIIPLEDLDEISALTNSCVTDDEMEVISIFNSPRCRASSLSKLKVRYSLSPERYLGSNTNTT